MSARIFLIPLLAVVAVTSGCQPPMQEFTSTEYKFKVKFPGKPEEKSQPGPMNITTKMFAVESRNGVMGVAVSDTPLGSDMPQAQLDAALDGAQNGMISAIGGTLKTSSKITLEGKYPGREFTASITQPKAGLVRAHVYLVSKRLYQVTVMGTDGYATSKNADAFFDSFQVIQ